MDKCLICLQSHDSSYRITTQSAEWLERNIQRIIEKHLWWWYFTPDSNGCEQWICRNCWGEIFSFHNFYTGVEMVHNHYKPLLTSLVSDKNDTKNDGKIVIKGEKVDEFNQLLLLEPVKRRFRGRPRKQNTIVKTDQDNNNYEVEIKSEIFCDGSLKSLKVNELNFRPDKYSENDHGSPLWKIQKKFIKNTSTQSKLKNFNNDELDEYKLECHICNAPLSDFRLLKSHYQNEHETKGYAMCCGKKFPKKTLLIDHLRVHKDPNHFKCSLCIKTFETRRGLELHADAHKPRERIYNCDECGKSYFKEHVYKRHKLTHIPEDERKYKCTQCEKRYATDYLRRQHEDITHSKKNLKICDICGKVFGNRDTFQRHIEQHSGVPLTLTSCDICGVRLVNKAGLRKHIKMCHTAENLKEQTCPYCSKVSSNLNAHRMHIRFSHLMQRKHSCHLCEKAFKRPLELKEHLSTHTGEALYNCPHCTKTFISNANLHKHRKVVHRQEWEETRLKRFSGFRVKNISTLDATNKSEGS